MRIQKSFPFSLVASAGAALLLLLELYLTSRGMSLCQTVACQIVGAYVRIGERLLVALGAGYFVLLAGCLFFAGRYREQPGWRVLPLLLLVGGAAFDGALLGFQFFTIYQHCLLCIGVALALALVGILHGVDRKSWEVVLLMIAAWGAGMAANAMLRVPITVDSYRATAFYQRQTQTETATSSSMTLIFSVDCPHCKKVFRYLAEKNPVDVTWRFAVVDQQRQQLEKLSRFMDRAAATENPFQLLLDAVHAPEPMAVAQRRQLEIRARRARAFLAALGLNKIPVLVVERGAKRVILHGDGPILQYLESVGGKEDGEQ